MYPWLKINDEYEINGFLPYLLSSLWFISFLNLLFYPFIIFYWLPLFLASFFLTVILSRPYSFSLCPLQSMLSPVSDPSLSNIITAATKTVPTVAEQCNSNSSSATTARLMMHIICSRRCHRQVSIHSRLHQNRITITTRSVLRSTEQQQ